ncbi:MAG: acyl carrier protein [Candidatus Woesearchaeota archaeon]
MDKTEIKQTILDIVNDIATENDELVTLDSIRHDVHLSKQLDLDSMDFLDIVMELRKQYGVEVPEEDYHRLGTLNSSADYLVGPLEKVDYRG